MANFKHLTNSYDIARSETLKERRKFVLKFYFLKIFLRLQKKTVFDIYLLKYPCWKLNRDRCMKKMVIGIEKYDL